MEGFLRGFAKLSVDETKQKLKEASYADLERHMRIRDEQVIVHLQSERGATLNGQRVTTVGLDPRSHADPRLQVRTRAGEALRLRPTNLVQVSLWSSEPSISAMKPSAVESLAHAAVKARRTSDGSDPRDGFVMGQLGRFDYLRGYADPASAVPAATDSAAIDSAAIDSASTDAASAGSASAAAMPGSAASSGRQEAMWKALRDAAAPVRCCEWNLMGCCDTLSDNDRAVAEALYGQRPGCFGDGFVRLERMAEVPHTHPYTSTAPPKESSHSLHHPPQTKPHLSDRLSSALTGPRGGVRRRGVRDLP